jgi:hypothetical protein
MIVKCIDNNLCSSLTLSKEYLVLEEAAEYYVILDDNREEITSRKSRFQVIEDGDLAKKAKATITELTYQVENDFSDIKQFNIRKNSKGEIKEISIKFNYE